MMGYLPLLRRQISTVLAAGATLGMAVGAAGAQQATATPRPARSVTVRVDTSDKVKVTLVLEGLDSLMRSLARSRALEEQIGMALRHYSASQAKLENRRALEDQLQKISESNLRLLSRIQMACTNTKVLERAPEGYLGVAFNITGSVKRDGNGPEVYRFEEPPEIVTVETGSPADRAGIRRGDRLLALDGRDVTDRDVVFAQLLVPGRRLPVRVERDGREQNLVVNVQKRPGNFGDQCTDLDLAFAPIRTLGGRERTTGGRTFTFVRPPVTPRSPPTAATAPTAPEAPSPPAVWTFDAPPPVAVSGFSSFVAGAQLTALTDDFKDVLGVDAGVMVQRVAPETPAAIAGLKGGDVIVEAGDRIVASARELQRLISNSDERALKLKVVRKGKARTVWLKWESGR